MNRRPVWSPDGTALAFISDRNGRRAVYSVPVDAIGTPRILLEHTGEDVDEVAWSSDGDWLVYRTGTTPNARDIYARRIGEDTMTVAVSALPDLDEFSPVLSPNGRWVAYVSEEAGQVEIWVRPFPDVGTGGRRVSAGIATEPIWSANGQELFFRDASGHVALAISDVTSFSTGEMRTLFPNDGYAYFEPHRAHAYDGQTDRFLMIRDAEYEPEPAELILFQNFMEEVRVRVAN
jgi:Tol biopolymer transport system component